MYGTVKFFIEVYFPTGQPHNSAIVKRVQVGNAYCTDDQAQAEVQKFKKANKHIPLAHATWTAEPKRLDVSEPTFTAKAHG